MPTIDQRQAPRTRVKQIVYITCLAVLLLALTACDNQVTPQSYMLCGEWNGRIESRPLLDGSEREFEFCVFPDGTECRTSQFYSGTCTPPGADAPLSPLPTPSLPPSLSFRSSGYLGMGFPGFGPPPSLDELINQATLIFIGEVGPIEQYLAVIGYYGPNGELVLPESDADGAPMTDFHLHVDEVLQDDGTIAADEPIILRVPGHVTEEMKQSSQAGLFPVAYTGDRYLFLLSPHPDGKTYGFYYGPWSRLIIDGDTLRVSNGDRDPLVFDENAGPVTLDALIQAINDE